MNLLDKNNKFINWFQIKKFNLRWLLIPFISSGFSLIFIIIFYFLADQTLSFDTEASTNFIIFLIGSILLNLSVILLYFGRKNIKSIEIHRVKSIIFKGFSVFFLILSITGFILVNLYLFFFPPPNILGGTGYNEGPWLTWYDNNPDTNICVTWMTAERNTNSNLLYGTNPGNLILDETGTGKFLHKVYLTGLTPNTTYYYKIPDLDTTIFNFTTVSDVQEAFKFAIVGDMQPTCQTMIDNGAMVANGIAAVDYDFIVQLGDIADSGADPDDWHKVLQNIRTLGSNKAFQAIIGNHDFDLIVGSSNWAELFSYNYANPALGRFYSFDYHNAHFIMIDNFEHYYKMSYIQLDWIKQDIINAINRGQDWIFCIFHLSMMTTSTAGMHYHLQKALIPIFDQIGVDAVFFGHDHDYQHFNYTYGANGLVYDPAHDWDHHEIHYFCSGGGGANLEVDYGVLNPDRMEKVETVQWYDLNQNQYREIDYRRTAWDPNKYLTHTGFSENYSWNEDGHAGKYYYYHPENETYNEFAEEIGFEYGEQCYHYIEIEINDKNCTISVKYPNGVLLRGPGDAYPQRWTFLK